MSSPDVGSITRWIEGVKQGDDAAIQEIWNRYYDKLIRFAQRKLEGCAKRVADEDDVLLSAFKSFCAAAKKGRFPDLQDRDGLWRLLLSMTARKAVDLKRYNSREKRKVLGETAFMKAPSSGTELGGIGQVVGDSPTPEMGAIAAEELGRLLDELRDAELKAVAVAKLEGLTNQEIAKRTDVSVRTVERQLQLIRRKWETELKA